jgi:hypothetical protein
MDRQAAALVAVLGGSFGLLVIGIIVVVVLAIVKPGLIPGSWSHAAKIAFTNKNGGCDSCPYAR